LVWTRLRPSSAGGNLVGETARKTSLWIPVFAGKDEKSNTVNGLFQGENFSSNPLNADNDDCTTAKSNLKKLVRMRIEAARKQEVVNTPFSVY